MSYYHYLPMCEVHRFEAKPSEVFFTQTFKGNVCTRDVDLTLPQMSNGRHYECTAILKIVGIHHLEPKYDTLLLGNYCFGSKIKGLTLSSH